MHVVYDNNDSGLSGPDSGSSLPFVPSSVKSCTPPMPSPESGITELLSRAGSGDRQAREQLFRFVEHELRKRARKYLRGETPPHDFQTTMLVDDAFIKLVGDQDLVWQNRSQFYTLAAKVMRRILIDDARRRNAIKRHGPPPDALDLHPDPPDPKGTEPLANLVLDEALGRLSESYPDLVEIVELHLFAGWDLKQVAEEILKVPYTTIKRRWQRAKAMLHREMCGDANDT